MKLALLATAAFLAGASASVAQPFLPRCGAGLDGQVSQSGCICRHEGAAQSSGREAGWRWSCDLLRGSEPPQAATSDPSLMAPSLPPGLTYSPRTGGHGY